MSAPVQTEICVIGGGPAGATIARQLALLGHDVCLLEKDRFPRRHIGESLSPGILPLLDTLGLRTQVEAAQFLRPERALVRWSSATDDLKSRPSGAEPGFQVDRGAFDALLLQAAKAAGVRILQPAGVSNLAHQHALQWHLNLKSNLGITLVKAAFVVDASGKSGLLPGKKQRCQVPTLALYAYWQNTALEGTETRVEAGEHAWFWGAPLPDGSFNAAVFIDPKQASIKQPGLESFYREKLRTSALLQNCLNGTLSTQVFACNATPYAHAQAVGHDFIRVGEASYAIDPLSSQGVQTALTSALQGAVVVHTVLTRPANTALALDFFQARQHEAVQRNSAWAAQFYAEQDRFPQSVFWQRRAQQQAKPEQPPIVISKQTRLDENCHVRLSELVKITYMPVIKDNLVVEMAALSHPALPRPIAYLGNLDILTILSLIKSADNVRVIREKLQQYEPANIGRQIIEWMWAKAIIVAIN